MEDDPPQRPDSLLPYDRWYEEASRHVVVQAIAHAAAEGLPGEHHFYISFRTDQSGVSIPNRLLKQYPHEMTIVLQHQFWDLKVDRVADTFSVGLSFGGVPATLTIPFAAVTAFADPHVQIGLRFNAQEGTQPAPAPEPEAKRDLVPVPEPAPEAPPPAEPQVVSLDAFRKRSPSKDS